MRELCARHQSRLASFHGLREADLFLKVPRHDILHEFVSIAPQDGCGMCQLRFDFGLMCKDGSKELNHAGTST